MSEKPRLLCCTPKYNFFPTPPVPLRTTANPPLSHQSKSTFFLYDSWRNYTETRWMQVTRIFWSPYHYGQVFPLFFARCMHASHNTCTISINSHTWEVGGGWVGVMLDMGWLLVVMHNSGVWLHVVLFCFVYSDQVFAFHLFVYIIHSFVCYWAFICLLFGLQIRCFSFFVCMFGCFLCLAFYFNFIYLRVWL